MIPLKDRKAVVVFSGGQDSTTCLAWALQTFKEVEALTFFYGQKHRVELQCAEQIAAHFGVRQTVVDLSGVFSYSALTEHHKDVNAPHELAAHLPASFVPGRNAVFLSVAASFAFTRSAQDLVAGLCDADSSGYPDCRRPFVTLTECSLTAALEKQVHIHTPLMSMNKAKIWKFAHELGVLDIVRDFSHTDYNGDHTTYNEWGYGKLDNPASVLRARGYEEAVAKGWIPSVSSIKE